MKPLSKMTWEQLQAEMSIAGSPEKITLLGQATESLIMSTIDATNRAELTNVELMLTDIYIIASNKKEACRIAKDELKVHITLKSIFYTIKRAYNGGVRGQQ